MKMMTQLISEFKKATHEHTRVQVLYEMIMQIDERVLEIERQTSKP